jgi:chromosome segregation ATPase
MPDNLPEDLTTQVLVQIRDEMRGMRSSFQLRFDALEARSEGLESRMESLEVRIDSIEKRMSAIDRRLDSPEGPLVLLERSTSRVEGKIDRLQRSMEDQSERLNGLESRMESKERLSQDQSKQLHRRIDSLEADLKKFALLVNETVLHYAGEMDTVRDRLNVIDSKIGISFQSE